jgi:transaldolase
MDTRNHSLTLERAITRDELTIKVFADGADIAGVEELGRDPLVAGFTTNPTLMRKAGITDYEAFAQELLTHTGDRPISFEVFSDEPADMLRQARKIAGWGEGVYVKIPVTTTTGSACSAVMRELSAEGIKLNVTGLMTLDQVRSVSDCLAPGVPACISVFAGRIADTGIDPVPIMQASLEAIADRPGQELIWASPREVLNVVQADRIGCHIITVTHDLLRKLDLLGRDLEQFSRETVEMFHRDAEAAGYQL